MISVIVSAKIINWPARYAFISQAINASSFRFPMFQERVGFTIILLITIHGVSTFQTVHTSNKFL